MPVAGLLFSCGGQSTQTAQVGSVVVTVTLSRQGAVGPNFDHASQSDVEVTVSNAAGHHWSRMTDGKGQARMSLPVGTYEADISSCPAKAQKLTVAKRTTTSITFDCEAA